MSLRTFPVLWPYRPRDLLELAELGCPRSVPWELVAPHEQTAWDNHGQSLNRLADRGGLYPAELCAVLEDRRHYSMPYFESVPKLLAAVARAA